MNALKVVIICGVVSVTIAGGSGLAQQAGGPPAQNNPTANTGSRPNSTTQEQTTGGGGMTNPDRSQTTGQPSEGGRMQSQVPSPKQNERLEQPGK